MADDLGVTVPIDAVREMRGVLYDAICGDLSGDEPETLRRLTSLDKRLAALLGEQDLMTERLALVAARQALPR